MNSILATEPAAVASEEKRVESRALPPLETATGNERMRHVPTAEWMARKVEGDIRKRVETLLSLFTDLASTDPRHAALDGEFRSLCRALERLIDCAKPHARHNGHNSDLPIKIDALLKECAAALHSLEPTAFGRRNPYHLFDRSKGELVYGALLSVIAHVNSLLTLARTIDPSIDAVV